MSSTISRPGSRPSNRTDRARKLRNAPPGTPADPFALRWRTFAYAVLAMAVLFVMGGLLVWWQPLTVIDVLTHARLGFEGFYSRSTTIRGERIHYYEGGSGQPVLLVHGLGSRAEDWANIMPQLKQAGFHVYAIDLLGYGRSARPADASYSIPEEAGYVEAFLAQRNLDKVNLVGWSMGGWVAMRVALDQPARIDRLVLCDSAGIRFSPNFDVRDFQPTTVNTVRRLYRMLTPRPVEIPDFLARDMVRKFRKMNWVVDRSTRSMFRGDALLDGRLGALQMPTLIMWGKQDHLIPLASAISMHQQIPQSVLEIYDGCGHLAPGQCANRIGPRMADFLNGKAPQPGQTAEVGMQ